MNNIAFHPTASATVCESVVLSVRKAGFTAWYESATDGESTGSIVTDATRAQVVMAYGSSSPLLTP